MLYRLRVGAPAASTEAAIFRGMSLNPARRLYPRFATNSSLHPRSSDDSGAQSCISLVADFQVNARPVR